MKSPLLPLAFALGMAIHLSFPAGGAPLQADGPDLKAQEHFRAGVQAQNSGQLDVAVREYQAALQLEPRLAEAHANLGLVYFLQSDFEKSAQAFLKATGLKPGLHGATLFLGLDYARLHRPRDAVPYLQQALEAEPANKQATLALATALWDTGQRAAALQQLRKTARLFPTDVDALYALGEAYQKSAERQLEQLPSKYARLLRQGVCPPEWKVSEAVAPGKVSSDPYLRALSDFDRKDYDAAEARLVELLAANSQDFRARYLLARTYEQLSLSVLSRMFAVGPNSYHAHQLMGRIYEYRWENDKALAEYKTAEQTDPAHPELHLRMGEILWREEQLDPAMVEFEAEIKFNPYDARAYAEMGTILVKQHESARAIPYLTKALQLQPDMLLAHKQLGIVYYRQKNYATAEEELKKALPIDHDGSIHFLLGAVYRDWGHPKEAKAEMEVARLIQARSERHAEETNEDAARLKP